MKKTYKKSCKRIVKQGNCADIKCEDCPMDFGVGPCGRAEEVEYAKAWLEKNRTPKKNKRKKNKRKAKIAAAKLQQAQASFEIVWHSITDMLSQEQVDTIQRLHANDLQHLFIKH